VALVDANVHHLQGALALRATQYSTVQNNILLSSTVLYSMA